MKNEAPYICLRCGESLVEHRCKIQCPRCGYTEDCSDAGLIDYDRLEAQRRKISERGTQPQKDNRDADYSTSL